MTTPETASRNQPRAVMVTPTYDEKDTIADLIAAILAEQDNVPAFELHVLVADSHSLDGSINAMPYYRRLLSVGANQVVRTALGLKELREITTSFRAFTREAFLKIDPDSLPWNEQSFIFVLVFLVRMLEAGARSTEVPMTMHPRVRGYSKMTYWRYIRDILSFSAKSRFVKT